MSQWVTDKHSQWSDSGPIKIILVQYRACKPTLFVLSLEVKSWCKCWLQQAMVIGWLWRGKESPWPLYSSVSSGPILPIWTWTPQITMVKQQTKHEIGLSWVVQCIWGPHEPKITTFSGRTALHLAACEGHLACVRWFKYDWKYTLNISVSRFLLEVCEVESEPRDRWGHTPLWDAQMFSRLWMKCFLSTYIHIKYIFISSGRTWWVCWRSTSAW